jgi:transcriptional regulator with XRE-family HTH domain
VPRPAPSPVALKSVQRAIVGAHLTMKELARSAGVSVSALEKYQQGLMLPSRRVRAALADALEHHGTRLIEDAQRIRDAQ